MHIRHGLSFVALLVAIPASAAPVDEDADQRMFRALSVRHSPPPCAEVEALSPDPIRSLTRLVEEVETPPWVPMRAAQCLALGHARDATDTLKDWVRAPDKRGLMLLLVEVLDKLPRDVALQLGEIAVESGSDPDAARARIARFEDPELRALAALPSR